MPATDMSNDILLYWHYMMKYRKALSLVGKRYVLDIEMPKFLMDCDNPKVHKLLSEFVAAEQKKYA
jgi:hypothetical protein